VSNGEENGEQAEKADEPPADETAQPPPAADVPIPEGAKTRRD